jgi:hypothetical protein
LEILICETMLAEQKDMLADGSWTPESVPLLEANVAE